RRAPLPAQRAARAARGAARGVPAPGPRGRALCRDRTGRARGRTRDAPAGARRRPVMQQTVLPPGIERIIFSAGEIAAANRRMAEEITRDYAARSVVLVGVLKGAVFATAD